MTSAEARKGRLHWAMALGGIAGPVIFTMVIVIAAARRPGYDHVASFISELGATGTPGAAFMNGAGFLPMGIMLALFGLALGASMPGRWEKLGTGLVVAFGIGVAIDGVLSCDPGCPQGTGSLANRVHNIVAPLAFVGLTVGIGLLGWRFRRLPAWRGLSSYSMATAVIALVSFIGLATSIEDRVTTGLWQRVFLATVFLWCAVMAVAEVTGMDQA